MLIQLLRVVFLNDTGIYHEFYIKIALDKLPTYTAVCPRALM